MLGSLVEKALTTPQQYPLTLNALVAACNQTTNRDPVVDYDDDTVQAALDELKELRLVRYVLPSHGRSVVRFRHVLDEALGLDARQCAVLAVLMLRGAQTAGELRIRTERMAQFDHVNEVEHELALLASRDEPLATNIGRGPGQKEERWASPVVDTRGRGGHGRHRHPSGATLAGRPRGHGRERRRHVARRPARRADAPSSPRSQSCGGSSTRCGRASGADPGLKNGGSRGG